MHRNCNKIFDLFLRVSWISIHQEEVFHNVSDKAYLHYHVEVVDPFVLRLTKTGKVCSK